MVLTHVVSAAAFACRAALPLEPGDVHVWLADPKLALNAELRPRLEAVLGAGERERHRAYFFEQHRAQYLVAHALLRFALSQYVPREPASWTFTQGRYGRPEIASSCSVPFRFSVSHTHGLVGVAVTRTSDIGFDLEHTCRPFDPLPLAERYFAPLEVAVLCRMTAQQQRQRFFEYWTLKEAYAKARGLGLRLPLDQCTFELPPAAPPRVTFDVRLDDDPHVWRFGLGHPTHQHCLALALRTP